MAIQRGVRIKYSFLEEAVSVEAQKEGERTHKDDTLEPRLEPCHRVVLRHSMLGTNPRLLNLPLRHPRSWPAHDDVKVHTEDTNRGIVSCAKVNMLLNPESEVAGLGKVAPTELVLLHFETAFEDLLRFWPTNGNVRGNLLVAPDTELADGVTCFGRHRRLAR
jgi:hypothetical protein